MFYRLLSALALLSLFGCAAVQTPSSGITREFMVRRSERVFPDGGGESYFYTAVDQDGRSRPVIVLDVEEMYYPSWPGGSISGDAIFTVTAHPDHDSLAELYRHFPEGKTLRPVWFTLGAGDSYTPMRGQIGYDYTSPGILFQPREPEVNFIFRAPGGIRAGFILQPLEHGFRSGPVSVERDPLAGICPSGKAFTATMTHESGWMNPRLNVRFVGRSSFYSCRYAIDTVEDNPFRPRTAEVVN